MAATHVSDPGIAQAHEKTIVQACPRPEYCCWARRVHAACNASLPSWLAVALKLNVFAGSVGAGTVAQRGVLLRPQGEFLHVGAAAA